MSKWNKKQMRSDTGSIAVEAAIIMPLVILCIAAVLQLGMLMYARAVLQADANEAVRQAAYLWECSQSDMVTGRPSSAALAEEGLYKQWEFLDWGRAGRIAVMEKKIAQEMIRKQKFMQKNPQLHLEVEQKLTDIVIHAHVEDGYDIPLASLFRPFGIKSTWMLTARASTTVKKPMEFVQDVDLIADAIGEAYEKVSDAGGTAQQVKETIDQVRSRIQQWKLF